MDLLSPHPHVGPGSSKICSEPSNLGHQITRLNVSCFLLRGYRAVDTSLDSTHSSVQGNGLGREAVGVSL